MAAIKPVVQHIQLTSTNQLDTVDLKQGHDDGRLGSVPDNVAIVYQGSSTLEGTETLSIEGLPIGDTELLGPDLITNGDFEDWTGDDPDSWTVTEDGDASSNITEVAQGARMIRNVDTCYMYQNILTVGKTYKIVVDIDAASATPVALKIACGTVNAIYTKANRTLTAVGTHTLYLTAAVGGLFYLYCNGLSDQIVASVTVQKVNIVSMETLGSELVTNGTMEADSEWVDRNTPTTNEQSATQKHGGSYSRKFVAAAQFDGIKSGDNISLIAGRTYKFSLWAYGDATGDTLYARTSSGTNYILINNVAVTAAWTELVTYFTATVTENVVLDIYNSDATPTGTFYIDDVSIKEVTDGNQLNDIAVAASEVARIDISNESKVMEKLAFKASTLAADETIDVTVYTW
jgi:hypothetical protein